MLMLVEFIVELFAFVIRCIAFLLFNVVVELIIQGPGYLILWIFKNESEPDEGACVIAGLAFWAAVFVVVALLYR